MTDISAREITQLIKAQLAGLDRGIDTAEVGTVLSVGDGIARVYGLDKVMAGELLEFPNDVFGLALNLEEEDVGCVLMGDTSKIREGHEVRRTKRIISVPVGPAVIGRVVDPLGQPLDGKGPIEAKEFYPNERIAPGVVDRQPVKEPMQTGLKAIDAMIPIGRGQRELIIGDRQTGKTSVALDAIINQKGKGVVCIYVAIGQKSSTVAQVVQTLEAARRDGAHDHRRGERLRPGPAPVHRPLRRLRDGRVLPVHRQGRQAGEQGQPRRPRPRASTTTSPSRRPRTARSRSSCAGRRAARRTRATSSTSTAASSSAPRS